MHKRVVLEVATIFCALLSALPGSSAQAQSSAAGNYSDTYKFKSVALGFGGAYRALSGSNSSILMNPAAIAVRKDVIAASGEYLHSGLGSGDAFSVSVVDAKATQAVVLGMEYDYSSFTEANDVLVNQIMLAAASSLGDVVYIGGGLKGYWSTVDSPFQTGPDGIDMDLGVQVRPISLLSLALTVENIFLGYDQPEFPLQMGFGLGLLLGDSARVAADFVKNFETSATDSFNAYFGGEVKGGEGIYLRGGFGLDQVENNNFYSVGAGIAGPQVAFNFTFSQRLNPTSETYAAGIDFTF